MTSDGVQEVIHSFGPECVICGDMATRKVARFKGCREWVLTCGPFRYLLRIQAVLADSNKDSDLNKVGEILQDTKRRWYETLCGVDEIRPLVEGKSVVLDGNIEAGPHYCDQCSPPGKVMEDLKIAKLVRSLIDPRMRTSSGQLVFPNQKWER
jgi:hypothetical protein